MPGILHALYYLLHNQEVLELDLPRYEEENSRD
jgi:hypothetical protein